MDVGVYLWSNPGDEAGDLAALHRGELSMFKVQDASNR
jgi:hypothetical protein